VHGTIRGASGSTLSEAEVTFKGDRITKTVFSDSRGKYWVNLPLGAYTMTASRTGAEKYRRPLFRVISPRTIVFDVTLSPPLPNCEAASIIVRRADGTTDKTETFGTPDDHRDICGGWERFPIFSADGASFDLLIRYDGRTRGDGKRVYISGFQSPVLVAFSLFTLTAESVTYDIANQTLVATGKVTTLDGIGTSTRASSMKLRISNESVLRLPYGDKESRE
jgi:hypothetical protein